MPPSPRWAGSSGELNIGQLVKERFGDEARLIGFGTHRGTVAAADDWDGPMEVKQVRPSLAGQLRAPVARDRPAALPARPRARRTAAEPVQEARLERFIGVIYRPETERWSHYAEAILPRQFDAWIWFDETEAVTPLPGAAAPGEDDMWPFGL